MSLDTKLRHAEAGRIFISVITAAELLFGLKALTFNHPRRADVARFLSLAQILIWDISAAETYADIRHSLITSGRTIGELDMMIAAHALSRGYILVTNNTRHFARIAPPLKIENWTQV